MQKTYQPQSGYQTYKRLLGFVKPFRPYFLLAILGMEIYIVAEAKLAAIVKVIIDDIFIARDMQVVQGILITLIVIGIARSVGTLISEYFMAMVGRGLIKTLRANMFHKLLHMPVAKFDKSSSGELLSIFTYNSEQVAESATTAITSAIRDSFMVLALIIVMISLNARLTAVFFVTVPAVALIVYAVSARFRMVSRRIQRTMGEVSHIVDEAIEGHQVVKLFGGQKNESNNFGQVNNQNYRQHLKLVLTRGLSGFIIQFLAVLTMAAIIFIATAGYLGDVTAGDFSAFIMALVRMFPSLKHLTDINPQLQRGIAAAESIFELLDTPNEQDSGTIPLQRAKGEVKFKNISFAYDQKAGEVLHDVSFNVAGGQTVALVGRSGSGKSTIAKLVPRFYAVMDGEILVDGININDYVLKDLRSQIAFVGQHVTLFNDTIANNIAYGSLEHKTREDIVNAAEMAHAMEFINLLPDGLDTLVGENGLMLSGGQRQRIAIARAILKDSPILILDEATSALDTESERKIQAAIENLIVNRTTLVIAHRLSTVENADCILVLDGGRIVESGTHNELLEKDEQYASLYKLQFNIGDKSEPQQIEDTDNSIVNFPVAGQDFLANKPQSTSWEQLWYGYHPLAQLLAPIGYLFNIIVTVRRWFYRLGVFRSKQFKVPVIVVGNVTVGGTGKTPLVIWLANHLRKKGYKPGIVSRGYKGRSRVWPLVVTADTSSEIAGDEAAMIVARTGCPMVVGPDRQKDVKLLLEKYDCNIVISDDGLQHYALARDIEIVVADGTRGFGNGMMLPAGPMREPKSRLKEVDYIVTNGARLPDSYPMSVKGGDLISLHNLSGESLQKWKGRTVHAVAAIGNPERFFNSLRDAGIQVIEHRFEDHYSFSKKDIVFQDDLPVVMTEKDAVKCRQLIGEDTTGRYWYLPVAAHVSGEFTRKIDQHIEGLFNEKAVA
jgi:subfamily B ATP-binding cassette protein MsbA